MVSGNEVELQDLQPAAGGNAFIDLRQQAKPPAEGFAPDSLEDDMAEHDQGQRQDAAPNEDDGYEPSLAPTEVLDPPVPLEEGPPLPLSDLSSDSLSMARMQLESDREERRQKRSYEFFGNQQSKRRAKEEERRERFREFERAQLQRAVDVPVPRDEFDPEVDDYHQSAA